jgi:hypothetical protein
MKLSIQAIMATWAIFMLFAYVGAMSGNLLPLQIFALTPGLFFLLAYRAADQIKFPAFLSPRPRNILEWLFGYVIVAFVAGMALADLELPIIRNDFVFNSGMRTLAFLGIFVVLAASFLARKEKA